jgi:hypothetical protein
MEISPEAGKPAMIPEIMGQKILLGRLCKINLYAWASLSVLPVLESRAFGVLGNEFGHAAFDPLVSFSLERVVRAFDVDPPYGEDDFLGQDVEGRPALFSGREHAVIGLDESWAHEATLPHSPVGGRV